jgi:hypothetical protein
MLLEFAPIDNFLAHGYKSSYREIDQGGRGKWDVGARFSATSRAGPRWHVHNVHVLSRGFATHVYTCQGGTAVRCLYKVVAHHFTYSNVPATVGGRYKCGNRRAALSYRILRFASSRMGRA